MEYTTLKSDPSFTFPKIINGLWSMSGGHGKINIKHSFNDMIEYVNNGLYTFDMADHYGPAEDIYGELVVQQQHQQSTSQGTLVNRPVQGFTKWFPRPGHMTLENVRTGIQKSLNRMKLERIDLLQFHWWDYDDHRYIDALDSLKILKDEGKINHIGLTNFDTNTMQKIVEHGIEIVTNQVSFSIIDRRAEKKMLSFCKDKDIYILAYGVCLGGLLSEKFLGVPEPSQTSLNTWSLTKYKDFVNRWGGWNLFQQLLEVLKQIGIKHSVSLTLVAIKYVAQKEMVGAVVIGCRYGIHQHFQENKQLFSFTLDSEDLDSIDKICLKGDCMLGWNDCGDEFR
ncbi:hypothetical protein CYY_008337 [Polysphondylium violaceum]|uniref:NADP-dependent oxidoreductase domain-containing protein n=1 Tax=Polysphondylium violaceum TaxID=133409 RepID=A0A8J4UX11_9MYCE|nr:hypothetical protein CYY_008337 [Polysphondylium violaceum]